MHDRILAVKHPMIGVGPFDPHAGFVAGDNPGLAKNGLRLLGLDLEPRVGADKHVHQRALADDQAKGVAEQEAQTLVGKRLKALAINRQRMDARSKGRRRGDGRRRRFHPRAAMRAAAGEAPVADDMRLDRRDLDLVIFADQLHVGVRRKSPAALRAAGWFVIADFVGIVGQPTVVRLMPGLRPARTGVLALCLLVRGRRLGRIARGFIRSLQLDHQLNQLVLAQPLQISAIHALMNLEIGLPGKGRAEISSLAPDRHPKNAGG